MIKISRKMSTLSNFTEFKQMMIKNEVTKVHLFIGNGPRFQYNEMSAVKSGLKKCFENFNIHKSSKRWIALFGGDTYVPDNPDLGAVMFHVKQDYNPILVAIQSWPELDSHVDYIWKYPEQIENGRTIYGGVHNNIPMGGTAIYLGDEMCDILSGVIDVGALGRVGKMEVEFAKNKNLNVIHVPAMPRYELK